MVPILWLLSGNTNRFLSVSKHRKAKDERIINEWRGDKSVGGRGRKGVGEEGSNWVKHLLAMVD